MSEERLAAKWIPRAGAALAGTGGWASGSAPRRPWMRGHRGEGRAGGAGHTPRTRAGHRRAVPPRRFPSWGSPGTARCMSLSGRLRGRLHPGPTPWRRHRRANPWMMASAWSVRLSVTVVPGVTVTRWRLSFRTPGGYPGYLSAFLLNPISSKVRDFFSAQFPSQW